MLKKIIALILCFIMIAVSPVEKVFAQEMVESAADMEEVDVRWVQATENGQNPVEADIKAGQEGKETFYARSGLSFTVPEGYSVEIMDATIPRDEFDKFLGKGVNAKIQDTVKVTVRTLSGELTEEAEVEVSGFSFTEEVIRKTVFSYDGEAFVGEDCGECDGDVITISPQLDSVYIFAGLYEAPMESGVTSKEFFQEELIGEILKPENVGGLNEEESAEEDTPVTETKWPVDAEGEIDLSTMPKLRDQGSEGLCWVFSAIAALEMSLIRHGYATPEDVDLSELAAAYEYRNRFAPSTPMGQFMNSGGNPEKLFFPYSTTVSQGHDPIYHRINAHDEGDLPYEYATRLQYGTDTSWVDLGNADYVVKNIENIERVRRHEYTNEATMKKLVKEFGAVTEVYAVNNAAYFDYAHNSFYMPDTDDYNSYHAIVIVGWDDSFPKENFLKKPERDGAWLCRNSWGFNGYGVGGYFWMSYCDKYAGYESVAFTVAPLEEAAEGETVSNVYLSSQDGSYYSSSISWILKAGDTASSLVQLKPEGASGTIRWSSSDTKMARVDKDGVVTIPSDAPAGIVWVTASCGSARAYMKIYVIGVGKCGDDLTYTYNPLTRALVIEGTGRMYDYGFDTPYGIHVPGSNTAETIEIKEGCTYIGKCAFNGHSNNMEQAMDVASIIMPDTVTEIGPSAIWWTGTHLKTFVISKNLKKVGKNGLYYIFGLTGTLELPSGLESFSGSFPWISKLCLPGTLSDIDISFDNDDWKKLQSVRVVENTYSEEWAERNIPSRITIERIHVPAEEISVYSAETQVKARKTLQLSANTLPAGNSESKPEWKSSDEKIAQVDENGVVRGISEGKATITCTAHQGLSESIEITVLPSPQVVLNTDREEILRNTSFTLIAEDMEDSETGIIYSSSDDRTVTVTSTGLVTGVKAGTAVITATTVPNGYKAECAVTVKPIEVTDIIPDQLEISLKPGQTTFLSARVLPEDADNAELKWTVSDNKIASIEDGKLKGLSVGQTVITVSVANGVSANCLVNVLPLYPTGIKIVEKELLLLLQDTGELSYKFIPENASAPGGRVTFESSDPGIALIDEVTGKITPVSTGVTTLTVKYEGPISAEKTGSLSAKCSLLIAEDSGDIILQPFDTDVTLLPGEVKRLNISKDGQYVYGVRWTVSDESPKGCVKIKDGVVTAKKAGSAKVTASCRGSLVTFNLTVDGTTYGNTPIIEGNKKYQLTATKTVNTVFGKAPQKVRIGIPVNLRSEGSSISYNILKEGVCRISEPEFNNADRTKASKAVFEITPIDAGATWVLWSMKDEAGNETRCATKVIVKKPVSELKLEGSISSLSLSPGEGVRLKVYGTENNTNSVAPSFSVKGKGIKVSKTGFIIGGKPGSTAMVTVKLGKDTASVRVSVNESATHDYLQLNKMFASISLPKPSTTAGKIVNLSIVAPKNIYVKDLTWTVLGNPEGVSCIDGVVRIGSSAAPGSYIIIATPGEGSIYNPAYCEILVK